MRKEISISERGVFEINAFEAFLHEIAEQKPFHERRRKVAREKDALRCDEAVFNAFEEGVVCLLLDVALHEEGLLGGVEESREFRLVCFARNPVFRLKRKHLLSFDDEHRSSVGEGKRGCFKSGEERGGIFETVLQLIPIGEENVLAMRFQCVKLDRDSRDLLIGCSIKFIDVAGGCRVRFENVCARVADAGGQQRIDDSAEDCADMEGSCAHEKDFIFEDFSLGEREPVLIELDEGAQAECRVS